MANPKYYVTTPVHDVAMGVQIGSLYTAILGDAIARHRRMCGFDVAFLIGTATRGGNFPKPSAPGEVAGAASVKRDNKKVDERLNLANVHATHFEHAYSAKHIQAVETLLRRILRRSRLSIYKGEYQGRRCAQDQIDVTDSAAPADCGICGRPAELISEDRYLFRLSSFEGRLTALYRSRPQFVLPSLRFEEVKKLVASGLSDIPISCRSGGGGIPWPDDSDHVVHPSIAELACYLSGVGFGQAGHGADEFARYWPANVHVTSSAALESHAISLPAFLMAADLPLPRHIFAHGTLSLEPGETSASFFSEPALQTRGSDSLRYYLLREAGDGEDVRVGSSGFASRSRRDLDEGFGRLANQILALIASDCNGKIPARSLFSSVEPTIEIMAADIRAEVRFLLDSFNFEEALKRIWSFLETIENLLASAAPYEHAEDSREKQRFRDVLSDACEGLGLITLLLHPVLPRATEAIWRSLGQKTRLADQLIDETPWNCLMPGTPIGKLEGLFTNSEQLQRAVSAKPDTHARG